MTPAAARTRKFLLIGAPVMAALSLWVRAGGVVAAIIIWQAAAAFIPPPRRPWPGRSRGRRAFRRAMTAALGCSALFCVLNFCVMALCGTLFGTLSSGYAAIARAGCVLWACALFAFPGRPRTKRRWA